MALHQHDRQGACESVLASSVLARFETEDPLTLEQAVWVICPDLRPTVELFDAIADAWQRYRHVKDMPWD
jgi:hypothetical protein